MSDFFFLFFFLPPPCFVVVVGSVVNFIFDSPSISWRSASPGPDYIPTGIYCVGILFLSNLIERPLFSLCLQLFFFTSIKSDDEVHF